MIKETPLTKEEARLKTFDQSVHAYFKSAEECQPLHDLLTKEEWNKIFVEFHAMGFELVFDEEYGEERKEQTLQKA